MNRIIWYTLVTTIIIGCGETSTRATEKISSDTVGDAESSSSSLLTPQSSEEELVFETLSSSSLDQSSEENISSDLSKISSESTPEKVSSSSKDDPSSAQYTIETEYIYKNGTFAFIGDAWEAIAWSTDTAHVFEQMEAITDNPELTSTMHLLLTSTGGMAMPLNKEWSINLTEYESIRLEYKSSSAITIQVQTKALDADSNLVIMGQAQLNIASPYTTGGWETVTIPIKKLLPSDEVDMTDITVLVFSNYFEDTTGGDYYIGNIALLKKVPI